MDEAGKKKMRKTRLLILLAPVVLTSYALLAGTGQPDETLPGFKANQVYQSGGVDHVNLFSGDPGIVIPLGPEYPLSPGLTWQLRATYTSKIWMFDTYDGTCSKTWAYIAGYPTLGAGWGLHIGYVDDKSYVSPMTGRHYFPSVSGTSVSSDGSGLRRTGDISSGYTVELPDGSKQIFGHEFRRARPSPDNPSLRQDFNDDPWGGNDPRWGLTAIVDRFGNQVLTVGYVAEAPAWTDAWKIDHISLIGRATPIVWNWDAKICGPVTWPVLKSISLPTANGTLTVSFDQVAGSFVRNDFDTAHVWAECNPYPTDVTANAPELAAIRFNGSDSQGGPEELARYTFLYNGTVAGNNLANGTLLQMTLPTGGRVSYTYTFASGGGIRDDDLEKVGCPPGEPYSAQQPQLLDDGGAAKFLRYVDRSAAVATRTETVPGLQDSTTNYCRSQAAPQDPYRPGYHDNTRVARQVVVTRPDGNESTIATRHIFTVEVNHVDDDPSNAGLELERRYYAGSNITGDPLRALVFCYESDTPGYTQSCGYKDTYENKVNFVGVQNIRRQKDVTWYGVNPPGGGDCGQVASPACSQAALSGYNSVAGEYATETKITNTNAFRPTPSWLSRLTTTHWTATTPNPTPWLLKLFDSRTTIDDFSAGCPFTFCAITTNYNFDGTNGFLNASWTTDATNGTLKRVFTSTDGCGNANVNTVGWLLGDGTLGSLFETTRTFQHGLETSSQRTAPAGIGWKSFDVVREAATDLITVSQDPNSTLLTGYGYDALGRLRTITPPGGEAPTVISYDTTTQITVSRTASDGNGTWERYLADGFGRLVREIRQMPGGYATRTHAFAANGQKSFDSEWGSCGDPSACLSVFPGGTAYGSFDPFGRPRSVTRADNTVTTTSYADGGIAHSDTLETVTIQNVSGNPSTTMTRRDILGRVIEVTEPQTGDSTDTRTTYSYNVLDKLAQSVQKQVVTGQPTVTQTRSFAYDAFGFLRSESHPEKGTTIYSGYDPLGDLLSKSEPGVSFSFTYDAAGRLLAEDAGGAAYLRNCYDGKTYDLNGASCSTAWTVPGYSLGRLSHRVGFNPGTYPYNEIRETFEYSNAAGRLSSVKFGFALATAEQRHTYNLLGLVSEHRHHFLSEGSDRFVVTNSYASGLPVAVAARGRDGQAAAMSAAYQPSGALASYTLGNGVTTTILEAANLMPRPSSIVTTGASQNFDTGTYTYDGAGNVLSIGDGIQKDIFTYDLRSRLTASTVYDQGVARTDSFIYDRFGNITKRWLDGAYNDYPTDPATNQMTVYGTSYDARGNVFSHGGVTRTYDALSRQTSFTNGGVSERYYHDGSGERVTRIVASPGLPGPAQTKFFTITPCRLFDTRSANGPYGGPILTAGTERVFTATGQCGIPAGARALAANLASVNPSATAPPDQSSLRLYPAAFSRPDVWSTAVKLNGIRSTFNVLGLDEAGKFAVYTDLPAGATMHAVVDVSGYFAPVAGPPASGESYLFSLRDPDQYLSTEYRSDTTGVYATRDYVWLGNLLVAAYTPFGAALPNQREGWTYFSSDHLGTPRLLTDVRGTTVASLKYRPFGLALSATVVQGPEFAGMERDPSATSHYDHARHYQASPSRFLSPDKLGGKIQDPQSWNRYTYARNNPVKYVDPDGQAVRIATQQNQQIREAAASAILNSNVPGREAAASLTDVALSFSNPVTNREIEASLTSLQPFGMAIAESVILGKEGEAAAKALARALGEDFGPKFRVESATRTAAYRILDGLGPTSASEVKNSLYVRFTGQLKDFLAFAEKNGKQFVLYIRNESTTLSKELQELVEKGRIVVRYLEPK